IGTRGAGVAEILASLVQRAVQGGAVVTDCALESAVPRRARGRGFVAGRIGIVRIVHETAIIAVIDGNWLGVARPALPDGPEANAYLAVQRPESVACTRLGGFHAGAMVGKPGSVVGQFRRQVTRRIWQARNAVDPAIAATGSVAGIRNEVPGPELVVRPVAVGEGIRHLDRVGARHGWPDQAIPGFRVPELQRADIQPRGIGNVVAGVP